MVRVLESNETIAERMSRIETNIACSTVTRRDNDSMSVITQQTFRGRGSLDLFSNGKVGISEHFPVRHAFEEDLQHSWVYRRAVGRGSRALSIATSTQLTQSWSILSGLSLSAISNLAVCALPVYQSDLQNSNLYYFNSESRAVESKEEREEVETGTKVESSSSKPGASVQHLLTSTTWMNPILSEFPIPCMGSLHKSRPEHRIDSVLASIPFLTRVSWLAACSIACDIPISATGSGIPYLNYKPGEVSGSSKKFRSLRVHTKLSQYFNVIGEMGQLWLAKNEDDPEETIGWIQSKHFFRLFQHFDMQEYKEKKGNILVKI